jgi:hypothetical protein
MGSAIVRPLLADRAGVSESHCPRKRATRTRKFLARSFYLHHRGAQYMTIAPDEPPHLANAA